MGRGFGSAAGGRPALRLWLLLLLLCSCAGAARAVVVGAARYRVLPGGSPGVALAGVADGSVRSLVVPASVTVGGVVHPVRGTDGLAGVPLERLVLPACVEWIGPLPASLRTLVLGDDARVGLDAIHYHVVRLPRLDTLGFARPSGRYRFAGGGLYSASGRTLYLATAGLAGGGPGDDPWRCLALPPADSLVLWGRPFAAFRSVLLGSAPAYVAPGALRGFWRVYYPFGGVCPAVVGELRGAPRVRVRVPRGGAAVAGLRAAGLRVEEFYSPVAVDFAVGAGRGRLEYDAGGRWLAVRPGPMVVAGGSLVRLRLLPGAGHRAVGVRVDGALRRGPPFVVRVGFGGPRRVEALFARAGEYAAGLDFRLSADGRTLEAWCAPPAGGLLDLRGVPQLAGVRRVGPAAFAGCPGLRQLVLPAGVGSLAPGAFGGLPALELVALPGRAAAFDPGALSGLPPRAACFFGGPPPVGPAGLAAAWGSPGLGPGSLGGVVFYTVPSAAAAWGALVGPFGAAVRAVPDSVGVSFDAPAAVSLRVAQLGPVAAGPFALDAGGAPRAFPRLARVSYDWRAGAGFRLGPARDAGTGDLAPAREFLVRPRRLRAAAIRLTCGVTVHPCPHAEVAVYTLGGRRVRPGERVPWHTVLYATVVPSAGYVVRECVSPYGQYLVKGGRTPNSPPLEGDWELRVRVERGVFRVDWADGEGYGLRVERRGGGRYVPVRPGGRVRGGDLLRVACTPSAGYEILCDGRPYRGPFPVCGDVRIAVRAVSAPPADPAPPDPLPPPGGAPGGERPGGLRVDVAAGLLLAAAPSGDTLRIEDPLVRAVAPGALGACARVRVLYLGGGLARVGGVAFRALPRLREVYLAPSVSRLAAGVFARNPELRVLGLSHGAPGAIAVGRGAVGRGVAIRVPEARVDAFRAAPGFRRFRARIYAARCTVRLVAARPVPPVPLEVFAPWGARLRVVPLALPGRVVVRGGEELLLPGVACADVPRRCARRLAGGRLRIERSGAIGVGAAPGARPAAPGVTLVGNWVGDRLGVRNGGDAPAPYVICGLDGIAFARGVLPPGESWVPVGSFPPGLYLLWVPGVRGAGLRFVRR